MNMNYEVVRIEEKTVVGIMVRTTNNNGQAMSDIGKVWGEFMQGDAYVSIANKLNAKSIGLYTDYEGDFTKPYNFLACCEVSKVQEVPENMVMKTIPAGTYARFVINGHVQKAVGEFWSNLWKMKLDRKYTSDFEEYQNNSGDMENQEIHIYIAVNEQKYTDFIYIGYWQVYNK